MNDVTRRFRISLLSCDKIRTHLAKQSLRFGNGMSSSRTKTKYVPYRRFKNRTTTISSKCQVYNISNQSFLNHDEVKSPINEWQQILAEEQVLESTIQRVAQKKRDYIVAQSESKMYMTLRMADPKHLRHMIKDLKAHFDTLRATQDCRFPRINQINMIQLPFFMTRYHNVRISQLVSEILHFDLLPLWRVFHHTYIQYIPAQPTMIDICMVINEMDVVIARILDYVLRKKDSKIRGEIESSSDHEEEEPVEIQPSQSESSSASSSASSSEAAHFW